MIHSLGIILDGEASVYKETLSGNRFREKNCTGRDVW